MQHTHMPLLKLRAIPSHLHPPKECKQTEQSAAVLYKLEIHDVLVAPGRLCNSIQHLEDEI